MASSKIGKPLNLEYFKIFINKWFQGAIGSAGSERLPYTQEVTGSNPVSPTK
jgi:hypothetical protein